MNKFEKQALNMLSDEEQKLIAGGNDELTTSQCDKLKGAVIKLDKKSVEHLIPLIAYGCPPPLMPHLRPELIEAIDKSKSHEDKKK